jgi:hypothetical protein
VYRFFVFRPRDVQHPTFKVYHVPSKAVLTALPQTGDSDEVDQHSALMPISVPGWSDQSSERSDAGFCILLKVIAIVKLVVVEAV